MNRRIRGVLLGIGVCACLALWSASFIYGPLGFGAAAREFDIEHGSTLRAVARKLRSDGIVGEAWCFEMLGRVLGKSESIKAGSYQIDPRWSALQLLNAITGSARRLEKIVLVEGWTFQQVRRALSEHKALRHVLQDKSDSDIARLLELEQTHPEGLLFPDTYYFAKGASDLSVLRRACGRMRRLLQEQWALRSAQSPLKSPYEALVLASIVEKETGRAADRALIAGVFANRLRRGMKLQADPTVIYGLGDEFDGTLHKHDLDTDGPYNTYSRAGLPPTPIAIPSLASLIAAIRPSPTQALYFVARGDGTSEFSESLAEHNRAVTKYQRGEKR